MLKMLTAFIAHEVASAKAIRILKMRRRPARPHDYAAVERRYKMQKGGAV